MSITLLKTDLLFFILIIAVMAYMFFVFRTEHLRDTWRKVIRRPLAVSAGIILLFYVFIAFLDSIHIVSRDLQSKQSTELVSILDLVLWDLKMNVEKTYSAPLAYRSFSKEIIYLKNGESVREFPRLLHGGIHLKDPENDYLDNLIELILKGLSVGVLFWSILIGVPVFLVSLYQRDFRRVIRTIIMGGSEIPWKTVLLSSAAVSIVVGVCFTLAPHYHILGTDKVGNDVLYQGIKSVRTGVLIGSLTTIVILPFALLFGVCAGYFGGWIDDFVQFIYTTLSSIPGVLLIAASALMLEVYMAKHADYYSSLVARGDLRLLALCLILGVTAWTGLCRYLRAETLKLREMDFVNAARAFGSPTTLIMGKHIVPNLMHIVMIAVVLDFSGLVLAEAALTYIDIGVDPSTESWGNMINSARLELAREPVVWWSLATAFVFMFVLVLAANIFADAVRDAFDPRIKNS